MTDQHFATKVAPFDYSVDIGNGYLRLNKHGDASNGYYWTGDFVDKRGFVCVYQQEDMTRLYVVHGGRMHIRSWREFYGDRTIARLARAFLSDLAGDGHD